MVGIQINEIAITKEWNVDIEDEQDGVFGLSNITRQVKQEELAKTLRKTTRQLKKPKKYVMYQKSSKGSKSRERKLSTMSNDVD